MEKNIYGLCRYIPGKPCLPLTGRHPPGSKLRQTRRRRLVYIFPVQALDAQFRYKCIVRTIGKRTDAASKKRAGRIPEAAAGFNATPNLHGTRPFSLARGCRSHGFGYKRMWGDRRLGIGREDTRQWVFRESVSDRTICKTKSEEIWR